MKHIKVRLVDPSTKCSIDLKDKLIEIDIDFDGTLHAYLVPDDYFEEDYIELEDSIEVEMQVIEEL